MAKTKLEDDFRFKRLCALLDALPQERQEAFQDMLEGKEQALFSIAKAHDILGIPVATLRRWAKEGTIKAVKRGKLWYIPRDEVERLGTVDAPE